MTGLFINSETGGAMPIQLKVHISGNKLLIECGGCKGWAIQLPTDALQEILHE